MIGINKDDKNLKERLYWIFDSNDNGNIDSKEIAYGINHFWQYSLEEKVQIFFNYCDENDSGFINMEKLRVFMLKNLHTTEDIKIAKPLIKDFFQELCQNGSHELTYD